MNNYDIIVVGAGHAGCEAALAAARLGLKTLLVTMQLDAVARMSCNPSIGGVAKGQIVREIDALGGEMGWLTDAAGLQFRMLNRSRGPAVWSPRAQCDKQLYQMLMKSSLEKQANLDLLQGEVVRLTVEYGKVTGIVLKIGKTIAARAVILTTGTFMRGLIHVGLENFSGGRFGEFAADGISGSLESLGFEVKRLKTGTPARVNGNSVDYSAMEIQPGDETPMPFSYFTDAAAWRKTKKQVPCWLTYTNERTHDIIRAGLDRSPLYTGRIKGTGPRYCPSIEDKVVRFSERARHQVFLEPEGYNTAEVYLAGISTSLPVDVQEEIVHSIAGLEKAQIMRYGYAIEYDYCPPTQLKPTLETKGVENLYFAGQINGTTGYEEAAAQGLMAGLNAALKLTRNESIVSGRDESYIGILIDDLVTRGVDEPYRMFTSRAEYRLSLRADNADMRLMERGFLLGLVSHAMFTRFLKYRQTVEGLSEGKDVPVPAPEEIAPWTAETIDFEVAVTKKYAGYIAQQATEVKKLRTMEEKRIPADFDFNAVTGFSTETRQKLNKVRPVTLGQASRIPGVTPADVTLLSIFVERAKKTAQGGSHDTGKTGL